MQELRDQHAAATSEAAGRHAEALAEAARQHADVQRQLESRLQEVEAAAAREAERAVGIEMQLSQVGCWLGSKGRATCRIVRGHGSRGDLRAVVVVWDAAFQFQACLL